MNPKERIDEYIAGVGDWRGKMLAKVRRVMLQADAGVTEEWKWMGSPVWYCDGLIAVANAHAGKVKVTFAKGALFSDVDHVFNAGLDGNAYRALDILENDRLNEGALLRLVKTAITYNRSNLKSKAPATSSKKTARRPAPTKKKPTKRA